MFLLVIVGYTVGACGTVVGFIALAIKYPRPFQFLANCSPIIRAMNARRALQDRQWTEARKREERNGNE